MDRREFLRRSTKQLLAVSLLGWGPWIPRAYAVIPVATIALILQTSLSVVSLFSQGGSSIADLLKLQTEMLRQIEKELEVINQWMKEISEQLDEIKTLLGHIPDDVVAKLNATDIAGAIDGFSELQKAYVAIGKTDGEDAALNQIKPKLVQRLNDLQKARLALMQQEFESVALIPTICASAYAETQMMIMNNDHKQLILASVYTYHAWLKKMWTGDPNASLRARIKSLDDTQQGYRQDKLMTRVEYECGAGGQRDRHGRAVTVLLKKVAATPSMLTDVSALGLGADAEAQIAKLVKQNILPPNEEPQTVKFAFADVSPGVDCKIDPDNFAACKRESCAGAEQKLNGSAAKLSAAFGESSVQLIALRSLQKAAGDSIQFLDKLTKRLA
jgi:hypothetical protein